MRTFAQKAESRQSRATDSAETDQTLKGHKARTNLNSQRPVGDQAIQKVEHPELGDCGVDRLGGSKTRILQDFSGVPLHATPNETVQPTVPDTESETEEEFIPHKSNDKPDEGLVLTDMVAPNFLPNVGFKDLGRVGKVRFGKQSGVHPADIFPRVFVSGGRTGTVVFAGGGGAGPRGNQTVGSIQAQVPPIYDSRSLGTLSNSEAWVRAGTGSLSVTRSYVGMNSGDQGNGYYVTPRAAARTDQHEAAHVQNSETHYNTHLRPMLNRISNYTPAAAGGGGRVVARFLQSSARSALAGIIGWATAITNFQTADSADNRPMGTIDRSYLASPTRLVDSGPGTVGGTAYQHRVHVRSEPTPT